MVSPTPSQFYRGPHLRRRFLAFCVLISSTVAQSATPDAANILIYSATREFRHDSIPTAIEALKSRSAGYNITFEDTEDPTWFREDRLGKYDAVVFLSTTGEGESAEPRPVVCESWTDGVWSARYGGQDRLSELPEQRRKLCRNPLCE